EKTRDIGILKALGASNGGVMKIFLGYGLLLGMVGAVLGTALGLSLTNHINDVEQFLGRLTGRELFPRNVYYFDEIPTHIPGRSALRSCSASCRPCGRPCCTRCGPCGTSRIDHPSFAERNSWRSRAPC